MKKPINETDGANKIYVDTHINKNIQSSNNRNMFDYVMDDPDSQLTEENDIELKGLTTYIPSQHQINKKVINMILFLDDDKGYYSSRLGINLYPLKNDSYTLCYELYWGRSDIETVDINALSSIETVHNINNKIFLSNQYARLVCQFDKTQNHGNNYLYIDIIIKLEADTTYPIRLQTYFIVYGIDSIQSDVNPSVYDALYYVENDQIMFNAPINMNTQVIKGIKEGTEDDQAVNFKQ